MSVDVEKVVDEFVKEDESTTTTDVKQEATADQESSTGEQVEEEQVDVAALKRENERLRKANLTLNRKVRAPKEEHAEQREPHSDMEDPLATRDGWLNEIDKRASAIVKPITEANFRRATDRFLKSHPEYAADRSKLTAILNAATGKVDEEEIFEAMGQAWAAANWRDLQATHVQKSESRSRAQKLTASAAGSTDSVPVESNEYTDADRAEAEKAGKPVEKYMRAKRLLEASNFNLNA